VKYIIKLFSDKAKVTADFAGVTSAKYTEEDCTELENKFASTQVGTLINFASTHKAWTLPESSSLQDVINALNSRSRVVLLNESDEISALVSRSTVIGYLTQHLTEIDSKVLGQTLAEAKCVTSTVFTVSGEVRAIDAFAKLSAADLSHLGLVEDEGSLLGNVSVKDISTATQGFKFLLSPVHDYINVIRQQNLKAVHPAIHAVISDTVEKTLTRLGVIKIHRLYVTGDANDRKPVGVVSIGDILNLFVIKTNQ